MHYIARGTRLYRIVRGRAFRVMRPRADWPALIKGSDVPAPDTGEPTAYRYDAVCWVCLVAPVRVYGIPCNPCRVPILEAYERERIRLGRQFLYLPSPDDSPAAGPDGARLGVRGVGVGGGNPTRRVQGCAPVVPREDTGGRVARDGEGVRVGFRDSERGPFVGTEFEPYHVGRASAYHRLGGPGRVRDGKVPVTPSYWESL